MKTLNLKTVLSTAVLLALSAASRAQNGAAAIQAADQEILTYLEPVGDLVLAIGAVVGTIAAIQIFIKWNSGDRDIAKALMSWAGACVFLILSGMVIKTFFGK